LVHFRKRGYVIFPVWQLPHVSSHDLVKSFGLLLEELCELIRYEHEGYRVGSVGCDLIIALCLMMSNLV
jgi:hypothetical protein